MTKEILTRFECDHCNNEITRSENEKPLFPYDKGWVYIYNFNMQYWDKELTRIGRSEYEDKHFCKEKCMFDYIKKLRS